MKTDVLIRLAAESILLKDSESVAQAWDQLARDVIEPCPFYERRHLLALAEHLLPQETHSLVLIRSETDDNRLVGLFPVTQRGLKHGFVQPVSSLTFDSLVGVSLPLIAAPASVSDVSYQPSAVWRCFLDFIARDPNFSDILHMPEFYTDGPCGVALQEATNLTPIVQRSDLDFERAIARCEGSFEDYSKGWATKKARNIRSRRRKLEELGVVTIENITNTDAGHEEALQAVLELERQGWKGKVGTALTSQPHTSAFAKEAYQENDGLPVIHLAILRLDGRIIAGQINQVAGNRAFFMKSGYDESLSKLSPGVTLYTGIQKMAFENGLYDVLDSCADAGHSLEEIWLEREKVSSLFVAKGGKGRERKLNRIVEGKARLKRLRELVKTLLAKASSLKPAK